MLTDQQVVLRVKFSLRRQESPKCYKYNMLHACINIVVTLTKLNKHYHFLLLLAYCHRNHQLRRLEKPSRTLQIPIKTATYSTLSWWARKAHRSIAYRVSIASSLMVWFSELVCRVQCKGNFDLGYEYKFSLSFPGMVHDLNEEWRVRGIWLLLWVFKLISLKKAHRSIAYCVSIASSLIGGMI